MFNLFVLSALHRCEEVAMDTDKVVVVEGDEPRPKH